MRWAGQKIYEEKVANEGQKTMEKGPEKQKEEKGGPQR